MYIHTYIYIHTYTHSYILIYEKQYPCVSGRLSRACCSISTSSEAVSNGSTGTSTVPEQWTYI